MKDPLCSLLKLFPSLPLKPRWVLLIPIPMSGKITLTKTNVKKPEFSSPLIGMVAVMLLVKDLLILMKLSQIPLLLNPFL
jgi:hypothetical protein